MDRARTDRIAAATGKGMDSHAASKADLERVETALGADLERAEVPLRADLDAAKADLKTEIASIHAEIALTRTTAASDKAEIKADIANAKWQMLLAIFAAVRLFATLDRLI